MPPLLVLRGDADSRVPVANAHTLHDTLVRHNKTVSMQIYPGAKHGFNIHGHIYDAQVAADAQQRVLTFLSTYLQPADVAAAPVPPPVAQTLYETAQHFYTVDLPTRMIPKGDLDQLFALPLFDQTRYTYTDD